MSINIRILNNLSDLDVETFARERTESMLSRFDERLSTIDMRVRDLNGGKGAEDINCSIDARLVPRGSVHVQATEPGAHEAILEAIRRLETVVAKTVDRGHRSAAVRHQQGGLRNESQRQVDESGE